MTKFNLDKFWPSDERLKKFNKQKRHISKAISERLSEVNTPTISGRVGPNAPLIENQYRIGDIITRTSHHSRDLEFYICVPKFDNPGAQIFIKVPKNDLRNTLADMVINLNTPELRVVVRKNNDDYFSIAYSFRSHQITSITSIEGIMVGRLDINTYVFFEYLENYLIRVYTPEDIPPTLPAGGRISWQSHREHAREHASDPLYNRIEEPKKDESTTSCSKTEEKSQDLRSAEELKRKIDL